MSNVQITRLTVGQMQENCYLIKDSANDQLCIIDPGDDASYIAEKIIAFGGKPTGILATHGHFDHILAALELQLIFSIPFIMNPADTFLLDRMSETAEHFLGCTIEEKPPVITRTLTDTIVLGATCFHVIKTPGHTPGSVCFYLSEDHMIFAGDTIFAGGGVGRTDFSYSKPVELAQSVNTILQLPGETIVYPGHGEQTTIDEEKVYHIDI